MPSEVEGVFSELGLSQYLDVFTEQGFDTWETILDVRESDLDALGVKLGHRRKLQSRIAKARSIAQSISVVDIRAAEKVKQSDGRHDRTRSAGYIETNKVAKRKYRRHPKPDKNAPVKPQSAYVLFSNKIRDDLKSQNLTFTELAKFIGQKWQSLAPAERDSYESRANTAKGQYLIDTAAYKKTPQYRKYSQYLHNFKDKQTRRNQDETLNKSMMELTVLRHGSIRGSATPNGNGSGSDCERPTELETPVRQNRYTWPSTTASPLSSAGFTSLSQWNSLADSNLSSCSERHGMSAVAPASLPSISDMLLDQSSQ